MDTEFEITIQQTEVDETEYQQRLQIVFDTILDITTIDPQE